MINDLKPTELEDDSLTDSGPQTNWRYISIVILAALIAGGVLGYQWWQVDKELRILEIKPVTMPMIRYIDVVLEQKVDVYRLIATRKDGSRETILKDVNNILPISRYGLEIGRDKEEDNSLMVPAIYSFAMTKQKVYISRFEESSKIYDYLYEYSLLSRKTRKISLPENYIFSSNHYNKVSPAGTKVAIYGIDGIGVFDLIKDQEVLFIAKGKVAGILVYDVVISPPEDSPLGYLQWKSSDIIEYPLYQETGEKNIYQLKEIFTVNLTGIKDETINWKTYEDEDAGFLIKYFPNWKDWNIFLERESCDIFGCPGKITKFSFRPLPLETEIVSEMTIIMGAVVYSPEKKRNLILEEIVEEKKEKLDPDINFIEEEIIIDSFSAKKLSYIKCEKQYEECKRRSLIFIEEKDTWIYLSVFYEYEEEKEEAVEKCFNIFDQMLSTFKFLH